MAFTADEIEEGAKQEEGNFAIPYGIFAGVISDVELLKNAEGEEKHAYRSGKTYYNLKITITYTNAEDETKNKIAFLHVGPYSAWMDLNKEFREATGLSKEDLLDLKKYKDKDIGIKVGADQAYTGYAGKKELFEGHFVGEYEEKKFIQNNIIGFVPFGKVKVDEEFMEIEKALRERFKSRGGAQAVKETQPGFEDKKEEAIDEEGVEEVFKKQDY